MTYDPNRDARAPAGARPTEPSYSRQGARLSVALMLGLMAAFVAAAFWFYASVNDPGVATDDRPAAERSTTTGAGPLPQTPTPPTVPSQPRE